MIRISEQKNANSAKRCYAAADYYRDGRGIVGCWVERARPGSASLVSWTGAVFADCVTIWNQGRDIAWTPRTYSNRAVGYDFIFSVSKSVSLLYGLSGGPSDPGGFPCGSQRKHARNGRELKTRVRKGGQEMERTTGNMVWAEFIHTTSWPVEGLCDPQLHAYAFVLNMTWDEQEERWKAALFRDIKRDAPYFQATFRLASPTSSRIWALA